MNTKNVYAYTLQPISYEVSEAEQRQAQLAIWRSTNKIGTKAWTIMGAIILLAILGIVFITNYSTIFCWVAMVCVAIYILIRKFALEWYVKRKMNEVPAENIQGIRLGVQPTGIVMRQKVGVQEGVASIAWTDIYEWYDTAEFLLLSFKVKTQQGAYILPKRMDSKNFPFSTIRKHLKQSVGDAKKL